MKYQIYLSISEQEYLRRSQRYNKKNELLYLKEAQRIHSVAWYISMITDDYISLDEELQELEKQREFEADLYSFSS